jgi:hypothetical protein
MSRLLRSVALVAVLGCSSDDDRATATAFYRGRAELPPAAVTLTLGVGGAAHVFRGSALPAEGVWQVRTPAVATPRSGALDVSFVVAGADGAAASGTVTLDLRSDWAWGANVVVDPLSPLRGCFGCEGARSFPLAARYRRTAADSVWIFWGGNSISHPVVY